MFATGGDALTSDNQLPKYRVVVADDNQMLRSLLVEQLAELGHTVVGQVGDGLEVVHAVARERPDVALIDLGLPLQNGLTAARVIAEKAPTAVVLMSGFPSSGDPEVEARLAGAHAYLAKPYLLEDVDEALEQAVKRFARAHKEPGPTASPDFSAPHDGK